MGSTAFAVRKLRLRAADADDGDAIYEQARSTYDRSRCRPA
jgi:hypothetical protein